MNLLLKSFYERISRRYELVNHVLTLGADILWRKRALRFLDGGAVILDLCTGTGDMARLIKKKLPGAKVIGADFSLPMLLKAKEKRGDGVNWAGSYAQYLPFSDNTFDAVTVTFAARNLKVNEQVLIECFKEIRRVLKPGGVFINLETSQPANRLLRWLFSMYIKVLIKPVGGVISGYSPAYQYLASTISRFYSAPELAEVMRHAGFKEVDYQPVWGGIAAIHQARK
ncbi:MAG: ubiquinone/menaquinone biosynthesis methyltransferase [Planctomycetes bacterium]|nr:ubiquinone/menaquinone biosynthesis methyltransferase [Planctomycetota bacterium]